VVFPAVVEPGDRRPARRRHDQRLLLHHYSVGITYWDSPWGTPSPDGKVVIFNSNMNGYGRYDLFVAEVPLRRP